MLVAIVDYSSTGATYLGLWAHLQQPLATTTGNYNSLPTVSRKKTVRAQEGQRNLRQQKGNNENEKDLLRETYPRRAVSTTSS